MTDRSLTFTRLAKLVMAFLAHVRGCTSGEVDRSRGVRCASFLAFTIF